jgi:phosphotransferase system HPr-like phosphotransfer protein
MNQQGIITHVREAAPFAKMSHSFANTVHVAQNYPTDVKNILNILGAKWKMATSPTCH